MKALALAGLAVSRDPTLALAAAAAYRDARAICADPGVVANALRFLEALMAADTIGTLRPVRTALAGTSSTAA